MYLVIMMLKMRFTKRTFTMSSNDYGEGSSDYGWGMPNALFNYMYNLEKVVHDAESENKLPREAIGKIIGNIIQTEGIVLEKIQFHLLKRQRLFK